MDYWRPKHVELLNVMNKINHQILFILLDYRYIELYYYYYYYSWFYFVFFCFPPPPFLSEYIFVFCLFKSSSFSTCLPFEANAPPPYNPSHINLSCLLCSLTLYFLLVPSFSLFLPHTLFLFLSFFLSCFSFFLCVSLPAPTGGFMFRAVSSLSTPKTARLLSLSAPSLTPH